MDVSLKTCATLLENLLTILCTDAAISTGRDPRMPEGLEGISGIHVQHVSPNFKSVPKFVLLPEVLSVSCVLRATEGSGDTKVVGAELNHYRSAFWMLQDPRNDLTVVADDERRSGRGLLF